MQAYQYLLSLSKPPCVSVYHSKPKKQTKDAILLLLSSKPSICNIFRIDFCFISVIRWTKQKKLIFSLLIHFWNYLKKINNKDINKYSLDISRFI